MEPLIIETLPLLLKRISSKYPDTAFQMSRDKNGIFQSFSYSEVFNIVKNCGAGLLTLGVKRGDHIGLISDNRKEWEQMDMGLLSIGCVDVPRGCDASASDLSYILSFAECKICIAENSSVINKILSVKENLPLLETIISFDEIDENTKKNLSSNGLKLIPFDEILKKGEEFNGKNPDLIENEMSKGNPDDLATIIFTSGTTGTPKGVMLTHRNLMTQLDELRERIWLKAGERAILVLPVWHVYERACEYVILCQGATMCYSKPIGSILLKDLEALNPSLMPAVPRVYEALYDGIIRSIKKTGGFSLLCFNFFTSYGIFHSKLGRSLTRRNTAYCYDFLPLWWIFGAVLWLLMLPLKLLGSKLVFSKIRSKLGTNFRGGISGGGAYPPSLDNFFWAIGVKVVEGYGMTETSPIISVRPLNKPIFGNVGKPLRGVNARIVDEEGNILKKCKKGILEIKGDCVMKGYYKNETLTKSVISKDGWLNTGDIAIFSLNGEISLRGRIKDTIVLRGGENVEPLPIEQKIMESPFIATAVLEGQDEKFLTALLVCDKDEIINYAKQNKIDFESYEKLIEDAKIHKLIENEIAELVNSKNGFRMFERINQFTILPNEFEVGKELSLKQEISRFKISEIYKKQIAAMYK